MLEERNCVTYIKMLVAGVMHTTDICVLSARSYTINLRNRVRQCASVF
jgi:hypothetical protein